MSQWYQALDEFRERADLAAFAARLGLTREWARQKLKVALMPDVERAHRLLAEWGTMDDVRREMSMTDEYCLYIESRLRREHSGTLGLCECGRAPRETINGCHDCASTAPKTTQQAEAVFLAPARRSYGARAWAPAGQLDRGCIAFTETNGTTRARR